MSKTILHVVVAGFHHKRGCQIEYCYPAIEGSNSGEIHLPPEWAHLPSLMLPDGVHNVDADSVCFALSSPSDAKSSVYGIACYRQIASSELPKHVDITRTSVQKSVCVLSTRPLFDALLARLTLITHAYFNERNFDNVQLLKDMYEQLCNTFDRQKPSSALESEADSTSSARFLLRALGRDTLTLFKLILLERRVLVCVPRPSLSSRLVLATLSLFPRMFDEGLCECASTNNMRAAIELPPTPLISVNTQRIESSKTSEGQLSNEEGSTSISDRLESFWQQSRAATSRLVASASGHNLREKVEEATDAVEEVREPSPMPPIHPVSTTLTVDTWGMPLSIYTNGNVCLPYACLSMLDEIVKYRACTVGATNMLFKHKRQVFDAILTLTPDNVLSLEVSEEVKRFVSLTTADLRFIDYILKATGDASGTPIGGTDNQCPHREWEGGDEWCRIQVRAYLISLYATTTHAPRALTDFNADFAKTWRRTHNYAVLSSNVYEDLNAAAVAGHPFAGQLGLSDVKLRIDSLLATPHGRKLHGHLGQTGKVLASTTQKAKNALSSFFGGGGNSASVEPATEAQ